MINYRKDGSIFDSGAQVLVNPVNAVGVMGKGWRVWLRGKLTRIEEVRKYPQPKLRAEINRQVQP